MRMTVRVRPILPYCRLPDNASIPVEEILPRIQRIITTKLLGYLRQEIIEHYTYGSEASQRAKTIREISSVNSVYFFRIQKT